MPSYVSGAPFPVLTLGLDWFTVTARDPKLQKGLAAVGNQALSYERDEGNRLRDVRAYGYRGVGCGSVSLAYSPDRARLTVSGTMANELLPVVLPFAEESRRLDFQITVQTPDAGSVLNLHWMELKNAKPRHGGAKPLHTRYQASDGGYSIYVGAAASDKRLVIYDKGIESPGTYPAGALRYEARRTDGLAQSALEKIQAKGLSPALVCSVIEAQMLQIGIAKTWDRPSADWRDTKYYGRPDADKRLEWLRSKVSPTVYWLIEQRGVQDVVDALAIPAQYFSYTDVGLKLAEERKA